jgi:UDP-N-acetyl-D-glucosamine dehydrogenase
MSIKNTALLRRQVLAGRASLVVVGQGYVGLSLACSAADAGLTVTGLDIDADLVRALNEGRAVVPGVSPELLSAGTGSGLLRFTTEPDALKTADVVAICVPTPLRDGTPDLSHVRAACIQVAKHLRPGVLVILESTTYPGTTEDLVRPLLEGGGLVAGKDFLLAYSPERIDPGNPEFGLRNTPRVVGGLTPEATGMATLFYEQLIDKVVVVSSARAAELAKLLENTFRHVNIALVNEMAMLCHEMDMDVWEVVEAAASKPFGFMPFYPGPGVGGHCIPLDPTYLAWQVRRDAGHQFRILEQAEDINAQMPRYVAARIGDALNDAGKPVKGARILVLGVAYKPDVGDVRESPALKVIAALGRRGASVSFHDPYVSKVTYGGSVVQRTELSRRAVESADCVALLTPHNAYDLEWILEHSSLVFDARNACGHQGAAHLVRL